MADSGVEYGAHIGEPAEEVEGEEERRKHEHDDRGENHGGLISLVCIGRGEVVHEGI